MFDLEKEKAKNKRYFALNISLDILTIILATLSLLDKIPTGPALISLIVSLVFSVLYRNSRKAIEENTRR